MNNDEDRAGQIKAAILTRVSGSLRRLTPAGLIKDISVSLGVSKKTVSTAIQGLVAEKELVYTYTYGCTFLEPSFEKPVAIADRIILKPPNAAYHPLKDDIVIDIESGAAFGNGTHPTTRLALEGLLFAFDHYQLKEIPNALMLDIGTGSGILAIAALKMGIKRGLAVDIDSCARAEAEKNIRLNGYGETILVQGAMDDHTGDAFALVTANLRMPTLISLRSFFAMQMVPGGALVVSGIKAAEVQALKRAYQESGFAWRWRKEEKDWAGLVFSLYCRA